MTEPLGRVKALLESEPDHLPYQQSAAGADGQQADLSEYSEYSGAQVPQGVESSEARDLLPIPAALTAEPPAGVALLCVVRGEGPGEFTMTWNDGRASHQTLNKLPSAGGQSIADIMHVAREAAERTGTAEADSLLGGPWQKAFRKLKMHWSGLPDLGDWIKDFSTSAPTAPHLVIWDVTGQDIPWELYHGGISAETDDITDQGWLGVALPVSRWAGRMPKHQVLGTDPRNAAGPILLFDDGQTHEQSEDPRYLDVYRSFGAERVGEPETSMRELLKRLEHEDFGLLVIRGHGYYAEDAEKFTVAGLPLLSLADTPLKSLQRNRPAILLNVCDSGRTWVDETAPNFPVRGFVEPFIDRGASTVIAVMAQIDTTHLHETALRLIDSARQGPVAVAEWLRDHRARYLRALAGDSGAEEEDLYRMFLTSSLYVCYSQPGTTLHITAASPAATNPAAASPAGAPGELPTRGAAR